MKILTSLVHLTALWYTKPHAYCALARDREIRTGYLREE